MVSQLIWYFRRGPAVFTISVGNWFGPKLRTQTQIPPITTLPISPKIQNIPPSLTQTIHHPECCSPNLCSHIHIPIDPHCDHAIDVALCESIDLHLAHITYVGGKADMERKKMGDNQEVIKILDTPPSSDNSVSLIIVPLFALTADQDEKIRRANPSFGSVEAHHTNDLDKLFVCERLIPRMMDITTHSTSCMYIFCSPKDLVNKAYLRLRIAVLKYYR